MNDDLISRAAAIDALDGLCDRECEYSKKQRHVMCNACHLGSAFDVIEQLPSAHPVITCDGCRFVGTYDTDPPCRCCIRREKDYYEKE